jgi:hypothetical protein
LAACSPAKVIWVGPPDKVRGPSFSRLLAVHATEPESVPGLMSTISIDPPRARDSGRVPRTIWQPGNHTEACKHPCKQSKIK